MVKSRTKTERDYYLAVRSLRARRSELSKETGVSWSFLAKSKSAEFDYDYLEPIGQTKLMCLPKSLAIILFVLADMKKMPSETWDRLVSHIVRLRKHVIGVNVGRKIAATRDMKSRDPRRPKDGGTL